jgi:SIR2-like domain
LPAKICAQSKPFMAAVSESRDKRKSQLRQVFIESFAMRYHPIGVQIEPPYGFMAKGFKEGTIVPFLGAGVNFGTRTPANARWTEKTTTFLPSGAELSRFLAGDSGFPSQEKHDLDDLAKVAAFYEDAIDPKSLRKQLHKLFDQDFAPCDVHKYLAEIPTPLLIVTTNYDDLTERALGAAGREYDLVVHANDSSEVAASVLWWKAGAPEPEPKPPAKLFIDLKRTTVLYKMHGTVDRRSKWDNYVITEDDYVKFLSRMTGQTAVPALFMRAFRDRHFLFLGYGLRDWNLRVVLRILRDNKNILPAPVADAAATNDRDEQEGASEEEAAVPRSWAIQFQPSDLERELWNARGVKIYDVDINEFVRRLRESAP